MGHVLDVEFLHGVNLRGAARKRGADIGVSKIVRKMHQPQITVQSRDPHRDFGGTRRPRPRHISIIHAYITKTMSTRRWQARHPANTEVHCNQKFKKKASTQSAGAADLAIAAALDLVDRAIASLAQKLEDLERLAAHSGCQTRSNEVKGTQKKKACNGAQRVYRVLAGPAGGGTFGESGRVHRWYARA